MNRDDERDLKLVRSAVYLCRLAGEKPSANKVIAAIKAVSGRGLRKTDVCRLLKAVFAAEGDTCGNQSGTGRELFGNHPGTDFEHNGNQPGTNAEPARNITRADQTINREIVKDIPPEPNGSVPPPPEKPKRIKVVVDVPDVAFEPEDERRIEALVAERNPSKSIALQVLRRFRAECKAKLALVGAACWRYGVDTALAKPAGWQYAVAVMRQNPQGPPVKSPTSRGAPQERYVPKNLRPDAEKLAFYASLGKGPHAIRQGDAVLDRQPATDSQAPRAG